MECGCAASSASPRDKNPAPNGARGGNISVFLDMDNRYMLFMYEVETRIRHLSHGYTSQRLLSLVSLHSVTDTAHTHSSLWTLTQLTATALTHGPLRLTLLKAARISAQTRGRANNRTLTWTWAAQYAAAAPHRRDSHTDATRTLRRAHAHSIASQQPVSRPAQLAAEGVRPRVYEYAPTTVDARSAPMPYESLLYRAAISSASTAAWRGKGRSCAPA
jgi:hypothetical protein